MRKNEVEKNAKEIVESKRNKKMFLRQKWKLKLIKNRFIQQNGTNRN